MSKNQGPPSIWNFFPYSTLAIVALMFAFRYDFAMEVLEFNASNAGLSKTWFVTVFVVVVAVLMCVMRVLWWYATSIYKAFTTGAQEKSIFAREREILLILFDKMGGMNWKDKTRWCGSEHISKWKGVFVNPDSGRIEKIILADNGLSGSIPPELGELQFLNEIDLRINNLKGEIPASLGNLFLLEGLYLQENYLEGEIPDCLGDLPKLSGIYLFNNNLSDIERTKELFAEKLDYSCINLPKLIAFDLDGTLWNPEMYQLWGGGAPFKPAKNGKDLEDSRGVVVQLLGVSDVVLHDLKTHSNLRHVKVAWVSTCDEPEWTRECLQKFKTSGGDVIGSVAHSSQIYSANKRDHFRKLKQQFPDVEFDEMMFFDNQQNNIRDVGSLGVKCLYCPEGLSKKAWESGLQLFNKIE